MNKEEIKDRIATFLFILGTMLIAMTLYYGVEGAIISRPIITVRNSPFKIGASIVHPGEVVSYNISYFKRLDIPGELFKQLIVKNKKTGQEYYLPLEYSAGHLPSGNVDKTAFVKIPDWAPEGEGRIKLSSMHFTSRGPQFSTAYTEKFEVKRK